MCFKKTYEWCWLYDNGNTEIHHIKQSAPLFQIHFSKVTSCQETSSINYASPWLCKKQLRHPCFAAFYPPEKYVQAKLGWSSPMFGVNIQKMFETTLEIYVMLTPTGRFMTMSIFNFEIQFFFGSCLNTGKPSEKWRSIGSHFIKMNRLLGHTYTPWN